MIIRIGPIIVTTRSSLWVMRNVTSSALAQLSQCGHDYSDLEEHTAESLLRLRDLIDKLLGRCYP